MPVRSLFHTKTTFGYTQLELALLSLVAQAIAYYARTGYWPRLAAHDAPDTLLVWP